MRDPLTDNYLALYLCVIWYKNLKPEQAFSIVEGKSKIKSPCRNITPVMIVRMARITGSKNFRSWDKLEQTFKVDRYTIRKLVKQYKVSQLTNILKQIQTKKEGVLYD